MKNCFKNSIKIFIRSKFKSNNFFQQIIEAEKINWKLKKPRERVNTFSL